LDLLFVSDTFFILSKKPWVLKVERNLSSKPKKPKNSKRKWKKAIWVA
jgi:hypothetical protein